MRSKYPLLGNEFPAHIERTGLYSRRYYGGDEPAPQTSTTGVQPVWSPEEQAARTKLFNEGARLYDLSQGQITQYPGAKPVPFSADTLSAHDILRNFATGSGQQIADLGMGALKFGLQDVLNPAANQSLQSYLDMGTKHIGRQYTDPGGVLSNIRSSFMGTAPTGQSTREAIAQGMAGRSFMDAVSDFTTKSLMENYGKGLDMMKSTMAFSPTLQGMQLAPATALGTVGYMTEGKAGENAAYEAAQNVWPTLGAWAKLAPYASLVSGLQFPGSSTTATASTGESSGMEGLGFGLNVLGALGGLF